MNDIDYLNLAEKALKAIELSCDTINDDTDADVDNQRSGGMVTLTFKNRSQIIVNLQKPLHEIWMAAKEGGFHYRFDEPTRSWLDTKLSTELFADLSRYASQQAQTNLKFSS
jgi:CyaY protein